MSQKFTLTAVLAIAVFLIAAAVVYGQGNVGGSTTPRGMMQVPYTATTPSAPAAPSGPNTAPGDGSTTPGGPGYMMGDGAGAMMGGGNGTGMMSDEEYQAMRDAMQNGDWEAMQNTCQGVMDRNQGEQSPQTSQPVGPMMGRGSRSV